MMLFDSQYITLLALSYHALKACTPVVEWDSLPEVLALSHHLRDKLPKAFSIKEVYHTKLPCLEVILIKIIIYNT